MKLIILEGPDGAGKTTLATILAEKYKYHVRHAGPPAPGLGEEETLANYLVPVIKAHEAGRATVFDRLHLGELTYGPVMRGGTAMTPRVLNLLERYYSAVDAQVVMCLSPWRTCFNNWLRNRQQEYVQKVEDFNKIYRRYARFIFQERRPYLWFDYTRHRANTVAQALVALGGRPLPPGLVGAQQPRFLFLGERAVTPWDLAFMTTGGCSGWFYQVLAAAGYREEEVAFANVLTRRANRKEIKVPASVVQVVALGEWAAARVDANEFPGAVKLPHPQYVKRFKSKGRAAYVQRLAEIRRKSP